MPNIQYEIFGQLERGDLDACQLVCRDWRNFVDENAARLPLHVLSSVVLNRSDKMVNVKVIRERRYLGNFRRRYEVDTDSSEAAFSCIIEKPSACGQGRRRRVVDRILENSVDEVKLFLVHLRNAFVDSIDARGITTSDALIDVMEDALKATKAPTPIPCRIMQIHGVDFVSRVSLAKLTHFTTQIFDVREFEVNVNHSTPPVTLDFLLTDRERTVLTFADRLPAHGFIDILIQRFKSLRPGDSFKMKSVKMLMKQKMDTKHYYMLPPVWMDIGDYWKSAIRNRAQSCPKCLARLKHVEYFTRYSYENHSLNQRLVIEVRLMASQYEKHVRGIMLHVDRSDCIPQRTRPPSFRIFPTELHYDIFGFVAWSDLGACQLVCRRWRDVIENNGGKLPLLALLRCSHNWAPILF